MPSSVSVGELNLEVTANIDPLIRGMEQAESGFDRFRKDAQRLVRDVMTPQEKHYNRLTEVQVLYQKGLISTTQAIRAQQMSAQQMNATLQRSADGIGKSSNRMSFAIGQALTGFEDFVTVVGTTGLGGGLRAASNNFAQAGRIIAGEFAGPLIGIGSIVAAVALPAIVKFASGAEDAAEATARWKKETDALRDSLQLVADLQADRDKRRRDQRDIDNLTSTDAVDRRLAEEDDLLTDTRRNLNNAMRAVEVEAMHVRDQVITQGTRDAIERMLSELQSNGFPRLAKIASESIQDAENKLLQDLISGNTEEAIKNFRERITKDFGDAATRLPGLTGEFSQLFKDGALKGSDTFLGNAANLKDASDAIQKAQKAIVDARNEVDAIDERQVALLEQRKKTLREEFELRYKITQEDIAQNEMSIKQEMARAKELAMLEGMNEAERSLFELQKQRVMLLEKGAELGAQGLEDARALSDAFLNARAANLQAQLDDVKNEVSAFSTGTASSAGAARAAAIRNIAQQAGRVDKDDTEQRRRIIDELKGIKRILDGQNPVELSPVL